MLYALASPIIGMARTRAAITCSPSSAAEHSLTASRPLRSHRTKSITVSEWGFKIPMTEFEKNLTHFDLNNQFQRVLRDQMKLTMDDMAADAFKTTPIKYTPQTTGAVINTASTFSTANANLSIADLRNIHDYLRGLKAPKYKNGKYVGILSTRAARGIKNDQEYKDWQAPTGDGPFMDARLRDVEGFMLIETNHDDALG